MSFVGDAVQGVLGGVASLVGLGPQKAPAINIPAPKVPAPPAPTARNDTGANVVLGTTNTNTRVSGRTHRAATQSSGDVLGGLGQSGLNI